MDANIDVNNALVVSKPDLNLPKLNGASVIEQFTLPTCT